MGNKAIILFVRNPVLGEVKTRLASAIGMENALEIYRKLLDHTRVITSGLPCDKYVFYADGISQQDIWDNGLYRKSKQNGKDLGERMANAFQLLFDNGYNDVLIIGSDCYELTQNDLEEAFALLNTVDAVLGPASDGGYYLLGLKNSAPELFTDMPWSSREVLSETTKRLQKMHLRYLLLPERNDVDEEKDLPVGWRLAVDG